MVSYVGSLSCCHAQALALLDPVLAAVGVAWLDILSTVPAGVMVLRDRPVHLLDPVLDPDLGLDRVLDRLGARYDLRWGASADDSEAMGRALRAWLDDGPVLLGPLAMAALPHLPGASLLYEGLDHYVVARAWREERVIIDDPEGFYGLPLSLEALFPAWRGAGIREGRGAFTMRRITGWTEDPGVALRRGLQQTRLLCGRNFTAAAHDPDGGPKAVRRLVADLPEVIRAPDQRNKLLHALGRRIEKGMMLSLLLEEISPGTAVREGLAILARQDHALAHALAAFNDGADALGADHLAAFAEEEERLTETWLDKV